MLVLGSPPKLPTMMSQRISAKPRATAPIWNADLISRYDLAGPRYTSYPTAPQFRDDFGVEAFRAAVERSNQCLRA